MSIDGLSKNGDNYVKQSVFTISGSTFPVSQSLFNSATLERGQFELDDASKMKVPRCSVQECIQSYQLLPSKIRYIIRFAAVIVLLSTIVVVTLFYFSQLSHDPVYHKDNSDVKFYKVGHSQESNHKEIKPILPSLKEDINLDKENIQIQQKVYKDIEGKVRAYDVLKKLPMLPISLLPTVNRKKIVRKPHRNHFATAGEISETLDIVRDNVDQGRKKISSKELRLWEPGTEPIRIILVSTWRSGSTFLASVIQSHPGVFQHYEPLSHFGIRQVRSGKDAFQAQQLIHRLLDCQYSGVNEYLQYLRTFPSDMVGHNKNINGPCNIGPNKQVCQNETFLANACKLFPIQLVKTVRMRLNMTQLLLNDKKLRAKVIFLVRDPRGIMSSRYSSVKWCSSNMECASPAVLCEDMEGDLKVATAFQKLYPDRFISMKYEDLARHPVDETLRIFSFLDLEYTADTNSFINNNTMSNIDAGWSIRRKSIDRISLWKKLLPLDEIHDVQNSCASVMKKLNYELFEG